MSIQAIRKVGFLIEDGRLLGSVIGHLRCRQGEPGISEIVERLDAIRALSYYEPVQPKLIETIDEVEEVA